MGFRPCMRVVWLHRVPVRVSIPLGLSYQGDGLSVEIWGSGNSRKAMPYTFLPVAT